MPIYEFYCSNCNTIYKFYSSRVNTEKIPSCPKCNKEKLKRKMSKFSVISDESSQDDMDIPIDESKLEKAISSLAKDAEGLNEENPRNMARLMRKFSDKAGLEYNDQMKEALGRLESGEDPEKIEEEMGDFLEGEELPFEFKSGQIITNKNKEPDKDDELYEL